MATNETQRLAAIVFADMVGYSSLKQGVALKFQEEMLAVAARTLESHHGRLVKTMGDGFMAEFPSARDAAAFAVGFQDTLAERNAAMASGQRFRMRLGIHVGDVVKRGDEIEGTTVVIAARAEPFAAPGGVCLTETAWQQTREDLPRPAKCLGRIRAKGLRQKLVFYHVYASGVGWPSRLEHRLRLALRGPRNLISAVLTVGVVLWLAVLLRPLAAWMVPATPTQVIRTARLRLERYDKDDNIQAAIDELGKVKSTDPGYPQARSLLGLAYWRRYQQNSVVADRSEASNVCALVLASNQDVQDAHFVLGLVALDRNRPAEATNHLAAANREAKGQDGSVLVQLAAACRLLGDVTNATLYIAKACQTASKRKPWHFYNSLGVLEVRRANNQAAYSNFLQATTLAGDSPIAWCNVGKSLLLLGRTGEALTCFEQARKYGDTAEYYYDMGSYYLKIKDDLAAADSFSKARELKREDYLCQGTAGLAALNVPARRPQADEYLTEAIETAKIVLADTEDGLVAARLGLYYAALGRADEAREYLHRALVKSQDDFLVLYAAIEGYKRLQDSNQVRALEKILLAKRQEKQ